MLCNMLYSNSPSHNYASHFCLTASQSKHVLPQLSLSSLLLTPANNLTSSLPFPQRTDSAWDTQEETPL